MPPFLVALWPVTFTETTIAADSQEPAAAVF
jgi:hypothetical protein